MSQERSITVADDSSICELIRSATDRLIVLAPAVSQKVANAIVEQLAALGCKKVTIILGVDPEVYRLGYGDEVAMTHLEQAMASFGTMLQRQNGIRVGLVISDQSMMVYSPTPQLIEASPAGTSNIKNLRPNAVIIASPPDSVLNALGKGTAGVIQQVIGLEKATKADIHAVQHELKQNPPQSFDLARSVRVFNSYFEFVEFSLKAVSIHKKTVTIPPEISRLTGNQELDDALQHSVRLVQSNPRISGKSLEWYRARLAKRYLVSLPGYGTVILRQLKEEFTAKVERLRRCVEQFGARLQSELQTEMDTRRKQLVAQIYPQIAKSPPREWLRYLGSEPTERQLKEMLDQQLEIALGSASKLIEKMQVKLLFKGITYETLNDDAFIALAAKRLPGIGRLHTEFSAAKAKEKAEGLFV